MPSKRSSPRAASRSCTAPGTRSRMASSRSKRFAATRRSQRSCERLLRAFAQEGAILAELSERTTASCGRATPRPCSRRTGDRVPYLVLEWLEGENLREVLCEERTVALRDRTVNEAVKLLDPLARALALVHAKGICHLDLKPGNVIVLGAAPRTELHDQARPFRRRKLRLRRAAGDSGGHESLRACGFTPSYAAPEQFSDSYGITGSVDGRVRACAPRRRVGERARAVGRRARPTTSRESPSTRNADRLRARRAQTCRTAWRKSSRVPSRLPRRAMADRGRFWGALRGAMAIPSPSAYKAGRARAGASPSV